MTTKPIPKKPGRPAAGHGPLRDLRERLGLTQQQLADKIGVDIYTIRRHETAGTMPRGAARLNIQSLIA